MAWLSMGKTKLNADAYYTNRVYRKELSGKEKRAFVGLATNYAMNQQLNPLDDTKKVEFIRNKVLYGDLLRKNDLPTTHLQAVAAQSGLHGDANMLRDVPAIKEFLRSGAAYPLFGKPASGSRSVGSTRHASARFCLHGPRGVGGVINRSYGVGLCRLSDMTGAKFCARIPP